MAQLMERLAGWIEAVMTTLGYAGIALIMLVENLFPPIPSELVMPMAGFLVAQGQFSFLWTIVAGTGGSVMGAVMLYYVGMLAGEPLVRPFVRRYGRWLLISEADLDRALGIFGRHGETMVLTGRVIPLVRSLISLPAGMHRMPMPRFLLLTTLGSAAWTTLLAVAGYILGANWALVVDFISSYQKGVLALIGLGVLLFVVSRLTAMRRKGELV